MTVHFVACWLALVLAACSATSAPASTPTPAGILGGAGRPPEFDQATQAIDALYRDHPDILNFSARGVTYTVETRDKVLSVCEKGGLAGDDAQRQTQRVLACAPLILFFYSYGQDANVTAATDAARSLYWYALSHNSTASGEVLTDLLKSWEIE